MLSAPVSMLIRHSPDIPDPKSRELILMLLECTADPFSRQQFTPGHITGTGIVFAPDAERILLIHHRRLDRWLLPGGHVEPDDAEIWDAARREVIEETGAQLVPDPAPPLAGLDVHGIPAGKGEPYHLHHDILFSFRAVSDDFQVSENPAISPGALPRTSTAMLSPKTYAAPTCACENWLRSHEDLHNRSDRG